MSDTIKWIKPSGAEIETNDAPATVAACEAMEWQRDEKPKRGRKPKDEK